MKLTDTSKYPLPSIDEIDRAMANGRHLRSQMFRQIIASLWNTLTRTSMREESRVDFDRNAARNRDLQSMGVTDQSIQASLKTGESISELIGISTMDKSTDRSGVVDLHETTAKAA